LLLQYRGCRKSPVPTGKVRASEDREKPDAVSMRGPNSAGENACRHGGMDVISVSFWRLLGRGCHGRGLSGYKPRAARSLDCQVLFRWGKRFLRFPSNLPVQPCCSRISESIPANLLTVASCGLFLCGREQRVQRAFVNELPGRQELDVSPIKPKVFSLPDLRQTNEIRWITARLRQAAIMRQSFEAPTPSCI
jgi:hypothetical protein